GTTFGGAAGSFDLRTIPELLVESSGQSSEKGAWQGSRGRLQTTLVTCILKCEK
ncbi:hypothetical protein NQZ68_009964, partial [Dissostichus eleginoides]